MTPSVTPLRNALSSPSKRRAGLARIDPRDLATLEAESHRSEVQQIIYEGIRRGTIRVQPFPGSDDLVKIVRVSTE
jgi:hypothetical protein